jgi:hypothetical protein
LSCSSWVLPLPFSSLDLTSVITLCPFSKISNLLSQFDSGVLLTSPLAISYSLPCVSLDTTSFFVVLIPLALPWLHLFPWYWFAFGLPSKTGCVTADGGRCRGFRLRQLPGTGRPRAWRPAFRRDLHGLRDAIATQQVYIYASVRCSRSICFVAIDSGIRRALDQQRVSSFLPCQWTVSVFELKQRGAEFSPW